MVIDVQVSSSFLPFSAQELLQVRVAHHEGARQRLVLVDVGRDRLDAGRGAAADDRDRRRRRDRHLVGEALHRCRSRRRPGRRRAPLASSTAGRIGLPRMCWNIFLFHTFAITLSNGTFWLCRKEWKPITPRPTERSRMAAVAGALPCRCRRAVDEALQHVVEEAHHVLDEGRMLVPLEPGLEVQRRQAAHRRALLAVMVDARRQGDLGAEVRGLDLQPGQLVVLGPRPVHMVDEDQVGLAGLDPRRQDADPQRARGDLAHHRAVLRRGQAPIPRRPRPRA